MINKYIKIIFIFLAIAVSLAASADVRKYHPGHYVSMYRSDGPKQIIAAIKPNVIGMLRTYNWRELDTSKYVNGILVSSYDFSKIQADMDLLAGQGMRLIVRVSDKTFSSDYPTPQYLQGAEYTQPNQNANNKNGYTAVRWNPFVVARFEALLDAMGNQFDSQPYFEGVGIPETALGFDAATLNANGYTPELYRDALIGILKSASLSFPQSRVFWYMNFLVRNQAYIADIATAVAPYDVVMGGPDVLPDSAALVNRTYPFYAQFQGKMKLFGSMQNDSYRALHLDATNFQSKYWTPAELFQFARDELHVNYVFWNRVSAANPADSYKWNDAIPIIGSNPIFNTIVLTDPTSTLLDTDGDGLGDVQELALGTDPMNPDTDGEGLLDGDEVNVYGTNPLLRNTDRDGINDKVEVMFKHTNPLKRDTDRDGLTDGAEASRSGIGSDPLKADTDGDGVKDGAEVAKGTDPLNPKSY